MIRIVVSILAVTIALTAANGVFAQAAATSAATAAETQTHPRFDVDASTRAYMATISPEAHARSDAYFEGGYWLTFWDFVIGLVVAWLLLATPVSQRMRNVAERITRFKWLQTALYGMQYILLTTLITSPWIAYESYFREHQYNMSNLSLIGWLGEQGKDLALGLIFGAIAFVAIYAVIRKFPRTWWLWGAAVTIALLILQVAIQPTYIEPVFNKFYPLQEGDLKQQILSLARANEIPVDQVYEFDASKQTTKMSAHVSGLFGTAQISMNDNLMNRATPEEIKAVLGHEMGHYVLNHIYKSILAFSVIIVIGFAFLYFAFNPISARYPRFGIRSVADVAGAPLLLALFSVFSFVLNPVTNSITRTMEAEADAFGLNAARQPDGFAQAAVHLSEYRKMQPGEWEEILFYDHPSGFNRIRRAMIWKGENLNTPDIVAYDAGHGGKKATER
jgi:STE24 endopeptidase